MTTARAQTPARRTGPTEDCVLRRRTNGKFYGFMLHVNLDELLRPRRGVREAQLHDLHTGAESLAGGSAGAGLWSRSSGLRSERGEALPRRLVRSRGAGRACKVVAAVRGVPGALRTGHRTTHHTTRRARAAADGIEKRKSNPARARIEPDLRVAQRSLGPSFCALARMI